MNDSNKHPIWENLTLAALGTVAALLVPLVAMQFTNEVDWALYDFIVMGVLLFGTSGTYVLIASRPISKQRRIAAGAVLVLLFFLVWAELAVGIFGSPFAGS